MVRLSRWAGAVPVLFLAAARAGAQEPASDLEAWVSEGRWPHGPKATAPTPQKQFEWARRLEAIGDVRQAAALYRRLAAAFPEADGITDAQGRVHNYAEESLIRAAKNSLAAGDYTASKASLDELRRLYSPPSTLDLMAEVQVNLARGYLEGRGEGGTYKLPSRVRKARRLLQQVYDEDPQGRWADDALLGLGQCAETLGDYDEAIRRYKELLEKYPESELRGEAEARIAASLDRREPIPRYSEVEVAETQERIRRLRDEVKAGATDLDAVALEESDRRLTERQARKYFEQARFYRINDQYRAAEVYYELIRSRYGDTVWAKQAEEELAKLRRR